MEVIRGIANNIRNVVSVRGSEDTPVTTTYISILQIDGRQIEVEFKLPINEGDNVLVVGNTRKGTFNAQAYKNLTTCTEGNENWIPSFIYGVMLPGYIIITVSLNSFFGVIFYGVLCAVGISSLLDCYRVLLAVKKLRQEAT